MAQLSCLPPRPLTCSCRTLIGFTARIAALGDVLAVNLADSRLGYPSVESNRGVTDVARAASTPVLDSAISGD
jgi:hypothetical protein